MFKNILFISPYVGALAFSSLAFAAPQTVTLAVPGMTCSTCPLTVKKALLNAEGVQRAAVSYAEKEALVTFDDSQTSLEKVTLATANAGYPSTVKTEK